MFRSTFSLRSFLGTAFLGALGAILVAEVSVAADPTVIELTQVPCQFLESEGGQDRGYRSSRKEDCDAINSKTATERLAQARAIVLKPGQYIFRVTNRNVPYELGFWLRGAGLSGRVTLPSVSGGGLTTGKTQDYRIELKAGEYVYSCPLNPTPDYRLIVGS
jgi:hypothetical protein